MTGEKKHLVTPKSKILRLSYSNPEECKIMAEEYDFDTNEPLPPISSSDAPFDAQTLDFPFDLDYDQCYSPPSPKNSVMADPIPELSNFRPEHGDSLLGFLTHIGTMPGGFPFSDSMFLGDVYRPFHPHRKSNNTESNEVILEDEVILVEDLGLSHCAGMGSSRTPTPESICEEMFESSIRDLRCDWPECSSIRAFKSVEEHKTHIKHHAKELSSNWKMGQKCTWYGCNSKASPKSRNLFDTHINNIHVNPLVCTVEGCGHKTPFRAPHDLQRHKATVHRVEISETRFTCPYPSCLARCREFIRKDKWLKHMKDFHEKEPCPLAHCQCQTENDLSWKRSASRHIGKAHGSFECALKSCWGKVSRFSESQLLEHMQIHHAMEWELALKVRDAVKAFGDRILNSNHLLYHMEVHDCKICGKG